MNSTASIVEIRDLRYAVNGRPIFDGLDVDIAPGRVTAIMGPSGTGKTTLLRLITGQLRADSGSLIGRGTGHARGAPHRRCTRCAGAWACCSRTGRCSPT